MTGFIYNYFKILQISLEMFFVFFDVDELKFSKRIFKGN